MDVPGGARLVVVTKDLDEESASALPARAPQAVPLLTSSRAWEDFEVRARPTSSSSTPAGRVVGEGSAATWPAVATLMGQAHDDAASGRVRAS